MTRQLCLICGLLLLACAAPRGPSPAAPEMRGESVPLAGPALLQRRRDLERTLEDLSRFQASMSTLQQRRDPDNREIFDDFVLAYLAMHVDPQLRDLWQSRHPELKELDANVRFAKADLLMRADQRGQAQSILDQIEVLFAGSQQMLVRYPPGRQTSLVRALEIARSREWRKR